jgi:hypothetical protein
VDKESVFGCEASQGRISGGIYLSLQLVYFTKGAGTWYRKYYHALAEVYCNVFCSFIAFSIMFCVNDFNMNTPLPHNYLRVVSLLGFPLSVA